MTHHTLTLRPLMRPLAAAAVLSLTACGGGGGMTPSPAPTPTPPVVPAPTPPAPAPSPVPRSRVTLVGKVIDEPIPNAQVVATVAGQTFTTTADAAGNYSLPVEINTSDAANTVLVTATGVGSQSSVKLVSLPGSLSQLVTDAGSDGQLQPSENIRANVTHVSTAEAALVMELAGGATPSTQSDLQALIKRVDPDELLDVAAAIKLIVDDPDYTLPAGAADTLAFAQSTNVRRSYIEQVKDAAPEDLEAAKQATVTSPDAVQATAASDLPALMYLATINNDARFSANTSSFVDGLTFAADGTGSFFDDITFTTTTWTLSNNQVRIALAEQPLSVGFPTVDTDGDGRADTQVREETTTTGYAVTFLSESLASITTNFSVVYPNGELPNRSNQTRTTSAVILLGRDFRGFLPSNFRTEGGVLMSSAYVARDETLGQSQFAGDILRFNANGTGRGEVHFGDFNWAFAADGALTVTQGDTTIRYNGVAITFSNQDANTDYTIAQINSPAGTYVDLIRTSRQPAALTFSSATLPATYFLYGRGNEDTNTAFDARLNGFRIELNADGTGFQGDDRVEAGDDGSERVQTQTVQNSPAGFLRWSLGSDGVVTLLRYSDSAATSDAASRSCSPATSDTCIIWDERKFFPYAVSGARHYWVEARRVSSSSSIALSESTPTSYIQRYWDREVPATAVAAEQP